MEKGTKIIVVAGVAGLALLAGGGVKAAVANAVAGQPQFMVKGFSINSKGGVVHLSVVNPGNQSFTVNSIVANILDNGTRIGMVNFTPGPGNPATILPASTTNIDLVVVPDAAGVISDALSSGQTLVQDITKISSQATAAIQTAGNVASAITSLFGGSSANANAGANDAEPSDSNITADNYDPTNDPQSGSYDPNGDAFINTGVVDPNSLGGDPGNGDFSSGDTGGDFGSDTEYGVGAAGDQHVLTMTATVNLSGINIQFTQPLASVSQAL